MKKDYLTQPKFLSGQPSLMAKKAISKLNQLSSINEQNLSNILKRLAEEFDQPIALKTELLKAYRLLVLDKIICPNSRLERILTKQKVRTLSGVAPIAIFTKPYPCPGDCLYCPTQKGIPKSYLDNEPAVMRAILNQYHPYRQIQNRLTSYQATGHPIDKVELIIMGGTWSYLPKKYQTWFIKECFRALNGSNNNHQKESHHLKKIDLVTLQQINQTAQARCVGLTLETRPDYIKLPELKRMRQFGCTRVEIGVQSTDDRVLSINERGHNVATTILATRLLKDTGFKVTYHLMLNLPGSSLQKDFKIFKDIFNNPSFQPDQIKIYPCVVVKEARLYRLWQKGLYLPFNDRQLTELIKKIKTIIPEYVRVIRVIRDIPANRIAAGSKISNLRQLIQRENFPCRCIRCRQATVPPRKINDLQLFRKEYQTLGGKEIFLSFEDHQRKNLYAFLRLRLPELNPEIIKVFPVLKNSALIREVHTYGEMAKLDEKYPEKIQHLGLGKKLISEAEKIAQEKDYPKIAAIAGIGVRNYFHQLGYRLSQTYMVKNFD